MADSQVPAWEPLSCKLLLDRCQESWSFKKPHSQAGAWERAETYNLSEKIRRQFRSLHDIFKVFFDLTYTYFESLSEQSEYQAKTRF